MSDQENVKSERIHTTLSDAALNWGDVALIETLEHAIKEGHRGFTFGAICSGGETALHRLEDPYCSVLDRLRGTLIEKLKAEELVAVAFSPNSPPGDGRDLIHPGLWRVLVPNFDDNSARAGSLELLDILVSTPEQTVQSTSLVQTLTLSDNAKTARIGVRQTKLPPIQYKLLRFLAKRAQAAKGLASPKEIFAHLYANEASSDNVRSQISKLREKLKPLWEGSLRDQDIIESRHSHGYALRLSPDQVRIE